MSNPKVPKDPPLALVDLIHDPVDHSTSVEVHGSECARTREVHQAMLEGRDPPAPHEDGGCKGPAKVNSDAYRSGWDSIFGKKQAVGQA